MSEWNPNGTTWNEAWDDGSGYDGFTIAQAIHTALTTGNANGYVYVCRCPGWSCANRSSA